MNLQRYIDAKQPELRELRARMPQPLVVPRPDFRAALEAPLRAGQSLRVIAEYKRSSPSAGVIRDNLEPGEAAREYAMGGAGCMSVLTEQRYFRGSTADLARAHAAVPQLPLLRKDFIFDELQVLQTFATPASALLLIVALTPDAGKLRDLREVAEEQGIHAVTEIFSKQELAIARASGARIIQVNARNLETYATDRTVGLHLVALREPGEVWIAASAISDATHIAAAAEAGYDAVLVGTALMRAEKPGQKLRELLSTP